jgi:hypothetical protein
LLNLLLILLVNFLVLIMDLLQLLKLLPLLGHQILQGVEILVTDYGGGARRQGDPQRASASERS